MATMEELTAEIQTLRGELDALRAQLRPAAEPPPPGEVSPDSVPERSRRELLKLAAVGLGGAGLAQMAVSPASAANGDAIVIGSVINTGTQPTGVAVTGNSATYGFAFTDNGANSIPLPSAIMGHARGWGGPYNWSTGVTGFAEQGAFYGVHGHSVRCGVFGKAVGPADNGWPGVLGEGLGDGVQGLGLVGVRGITHDETAGAAAVVGAPSTPNVPALRAGGDSGLLTLNGAQPAPPSTGTYRRGDVLNDQNGSGVWVCVTAGTPGVWRKVAGAASAGAYHSKTGVRAYDSRQQGGKILAGQTRTIAIGSIVPARTTAIHYVLSVIKTGGKGSLVAHAAGVTRPAITSISWWGAGQRHSNALTTDVSSNRELNIYAAGGSTHFTIDVLGYFL